MSMSTYLDEIVRYPSEAMRLIGEDVYCVGLLTDVPFGDVRDEDKDIAYGRIFNYQFVNATTSEVLAYVFCEIDVPRVENSTFKNIRLFVTVACHRDFMELDRAKFKGVAGNRRDNLVRYIDRVLNFSDIFGIGKLSLKSIKTGSLSDKFTARELEYRVPDFNMREL